MPLKIIVCIINNACIMGLVHQYFGYRFHILYSNLNNEFIKLGSSQVLKSLVFSLSCIQRGKEKWYSAASVHKWTRETNESLWVIGAFTTVDIRHTFPHCPHFTWLRFLISTLKMCEPLILYQRSWYTFHWRCLTRTKLLKCCISADVQRLALLSRTAAM